MGIKPG